MWSLEDIILVINDLPDDIDLAAMKQAITTNLQQYSQVNRAIVIVLDLDAQSVATFGITPDSLNE